MGPGREAEFGHGVFDDHAGRWLQGTVRFHLPVTHGGIIANRAGSKTPRLARSRLQDSHANVRIGASPDTVAVWESGNSKPSPWLLRILAAYFAHGGRPTIGQQTFEANKLLFSECLKLFLGRHLKEKVRAGTDPRPACRAARDHDLGRPWLGGKKVYAEGSPHPENNHVHGVCTRGNPAQNPR